MNTIQTQREILKKYYISNNISNYPKNSNGMPDMRRGFNRQTLKKIFKNNINQETTKQTFQEIYDEPCCICLEPKNSNHALLGCKHSF